MSYANESRAKLRSASIGRRCLCLRRLLARRARDATAGGGARLRSARDGRRWLCLRR